MTEGVLSMKPNDPKSGSLQEFVKHYQVCWERWPAYLMVGGKERQVGFELELSGTSEIGTNHLGPGLSDVQACLLRAARHSRLDFSEGRAPFAV